MQPFYRLSIHVMPATRAELEAFLEPQSTLSFHCPQQETSEDWTDNLYPEQIKERLRAGLAQYLETEQPRTTHRPR